jgi:hypothetical protein
MLRKSGREISRTAWRRHPLPPPFAVDFQCGPRVLQSSMFCCVRRGWAARGPSPVTSALLPHWPCPRACARLEAGGVCEAQRQANVNEAGACPCQ